MSDYTDHRDITAVPAESSVRVHVGLDVHKDTVAVAVAWRDPDFDAMEVEDRATIPNRPNTLVRLTEALSEEFGGTLHLVYEAGACGFVIWRQLRDLGLGCEVVAPTLIPKKPGERVKTDRRDARELARLSVLGYLTPVWVPDTEQEAMRDLVRLRADLKAGIKKQRQQLNHFLLRHGHHWQKTRWNQGHRAWMSDRRFTHPAQQIALVTALDTLEQHEMRLAELDRDIVAQSEQWAWNPVLQSLRALRGVDLLTAVTVAAEIGDLRRFPSAGQFMAFLGLVPGEFSSGGRRRTGAITRTGNSVLILLNWDAESTKWDKPTFHCFGGDPFQRSQCRYLTVFSSLCQCVVVRACEQHLWKNRTAECFSTLTSAVWSFPSGLVMGGW